MGMILGRIAPFLITAIVTFAFGFFAGNKNGESRALKLGKNFERLAFFEAQECRVDKASLISQVGQERQRTREIIENFQNITQLSSAKQRQMMADMEATRQKLLAQEAETAELLNRLQAETQEDAEAWKRGVVPRSITCGVFDGAGCTNVRASTTGTNGDGDMEVRSRAADDVDPDAMP